MQLASYGKTLDKAQRYERTVRENRAGESGGRKLYVFAEKGQDRPKGKYAQEKMKEKNGGVTKF